MSIKYQISQELPVTHEVDVAVFGGGPGGLGAAVMAARMGAKTLLVERYGCLGGMATVGEVHPFMCNHNKMRSMDRPVYTDWVYKMMEYRPGEKPQGNEDPPNSGRQISKDICMLAMEDLVLESGAQILYHHNLFDVVKKNGRIEAAVLFSKSGLTAVKAKTYIDCTGDADLAFRAGCECEQGGPSGYCQPMTLCFKLAGVKKLEESELKGVPEKANEIYLKAKAAGKVDCPRENILKFQWIDSDVIHFNTTRVIKKSGVNGVELSEAEIEARRQLRQIVKLFREEVPGYENARIHSIAHHIGVRETRRVVGRAYLTRASFEKAEKFPDAIARVNYPIDIHNPNGAGTEICRVPQDDWYEIPYGCIVPKGMANLLVGGRPISVDHAVHSSMRVMPPACSVGQAAGMAAALAVKKNCTPPELDGVEVRKNLVEQGAFL